LGGGLGWRPLFGFLRTFWASASPRSLIVVEQLKKAWIGVMQKDWMKKDTATWLGIAARGW
jgi:hypothetical protein